MFIVAKYTLVEAYKRRFILLFCLTLITSLAVGGYAAGLAVVSKQYTLAAFYGFCARIAAVTLLAGYIILNESRALESDRASLAFGLPIHRAQYLAAKWLAYLAVALVMALLAALPLTIMPVSAANLLSWTLSLYCELLIVISVSLMLSLIFTQPLLSLLVFGVFYLFARGSGEFARHSGHILDTHPGGLDTLMAWTVKAATLIVPTLGEFAPAVLLLHEHPAETAWLPLLTQTLLFTALLLAVSAERLLRKQF
ncbi:MAG TPA: hypothetical protein VF268_16160 [Gammaproteobacteria bacterium]|jgi:hypothetical protein